MCTGATFCFPNYYRCSFKILIIVTGNQQIFQHLFSGLLPFRGDGYKECIISKVFIEKVRPNENGGSFKVNNIYNINIVFYRYFTCLYKCSFQKENYTDIFF